MAKSDSKLLMTARRRLPHLLRVIVKAAGVDAAAAMVAAFGGQQIYIPAKASDNHPLVRVGGRMAADALIKERGGEHLVFPKRGLDPRRLKVFSMLKAGASVNQVVRASHLSQRQVNRLKARLRDMAQ